MTGDFEIVFEGEMPGTPEQVWEAVIERPSAWLFPTEGMAGEELVDERPIRHVTRMEGPDGWFNQLEQVITPIGDDRSGLRWVHSGVFTEQWETHHDAASQHTVFYMHTLTQYLEHFAPRPAAFADLAGPKASMGANAFDTVRGALGIHRDTGQGERIAVALPGAPDGAIVDLQDDLFVGLRTEDTLIRLFGRNAFGGAVGITIHHFGDADIGELQRGWTEWLDALFD